MDPAPLPRRRTIPRLQPRVVGGWKAGSPQLQVFGYDFLNRLTSASATGGSGGTYAQETYIYDAVSGLMTTKAGVGYTYSSPGHAHAVSLAGTTSYSYDANGSQTVRDPSGSTLYTFTYDAENRLSAVTGSATAAFIYDGDGKRVKGTVGSTTTTYLGEYFEWATSTSNMKKYYYAGGARVAVRTGTSADSVSLKWLLGDHLGSTSITATSTGAKGAEVRYKPWGENRYTSGTTLTTFRFTGQRQESGIGLYFYNARWYDPYLNRWIQPDTIIPNPNNTLDWDRYSYTKNNPIRYNDPTGHWIESAFDIASIAYDVYDISKNGLNWGTGLALAADIGSLILPGVTGGGLAVRALSHADEVVDAARVVDAAGDAAQTINQGINTVQAANQVTNGLSAFSAASEYGIKSYNDLRTLTKGTGLEAHHLIEQRFAKTLGLNPGDIPSIALTQKEHLTLTKAWRDAIGYSSDGKELTTLTATTEDIWKAAQKIYANYPELLAAVKKSLGK